MSKTLLAESYRTISLLMSEFCPDKISSSIYQKASLIKAELKKELGDNLYGSIDNNALSQISVFGRKDTIRKHVDDVFDKMSTETEITEVRFYGSICLQDSDMPIHIVQ